MNFNFLSKQSKGFTVVEILIVIAILGLITAVVVPSVANFRRQQALRNGVEEIVSMLERARSKTLASESSQAYGVSINTTTKTLSLFAVISGSNVTQESSIIDSSVTITTSLTPASSGDPDVTFARLSGEASRVGTITLSNSSGNTKTISISKTGIISGN